MLIVYWCCVYHSFFGSSHLVVLVLVSPFEQRVAWDFRKVIYCFRAGEALTVVGQKLQGCP